MKPLALTLMMICVFYCSITSCSPDLPQEQPHSVVKVAEEICPSPVHSERDLANAVRLMKDAPAWHKMTDLDPAYAIISDDPLFNEDTSDLNRLQVKFETITAELACFDTATLRQLTLVHGNDLKYNVFFYILLRYIFDVPVLISKNQPIFGGVQRLPYVGDMKPGMSPWANRNGKLRLVGRPGPYSGPTFTPLPAFDDFAVRYGRRKVVCCDDPKPEPAPP